MKYCKWHNELLMDYFDFEAIHFTDLRRAWLQIYKCADPDKESFTAEEAMDMTFNVLFELLAMWKIEKEKEKNDIERKRILSDIAKGNA